VHVEACLAYAMQDTYRPDPSSPPLQPWFGVWVPPDKKRKPILICAAGGTRKEVEQSALSRLFLHHRETGQPSQLVLRRAQDPSNVLWRTMQGDMSTPNQIAQGIALRVALTHLFPPLYRESQEEAISSALRFLTLQTTRAMMSVQHGPRIISEFCGVSHLWIWLLAYSYMRWVALRIKHPDLLAATDLLWTQLLAYMSASGTPDGHLLCAGPRAWSRPDPTKPAPRKFSFQSAAGDAIYCDLLLPSHRWPDKKLKGLDMLGARIVRDLGNRIINSTGDKAKAVDLPPSLDPLTIARSNGQVAVWLSDTCSNMTRPGPLWWSHWIAGRLTYGVQPENRAPAYGLFSGTVHPRVMPWDQKLQIRKLGEQE
jgi:hypothetical protein